MLGQHNREQAVRHLRRAEELVEGSGWNVERDAALAQAYAILYLADVMQRGDNK